METPGSDSERNVHYRDYRVVLVHRFVAIVVPPRSTSPPGVTRMKFAFCIFAYFPYGGLQRDCMQLVRECQRRGHVVDLYTGEWDGPRPDDISVVLIPSGAFTNHGVNVRFARNVLPQLQAGNYDAVVGFNKMPGLDVYYAGDVSYAQRVLPLSPVKRAMPRYRQLLAFERAVFGPTSTAEIVLLAESQQDDYVRHYHTPPHRFHIMPPDMPRDRLFTGDRSIARVSARSRFKLQTGDRLILMVGSGFKAKGVDRAIRALAALPSSLRAISRLVVVGEDNAAPYRALARTLNVSASVEFVGGQSNVEPYYLAADLLIHPAYHEMTGTVLLEAMGHGLPVLTTDTCGFAIHIRRAKAGEVLISPFNQDALNDRLTAMLNASAQEEWSTNGLRYMRNLPLGLRARSAADVIEETARRASVSCPPAR